MLSLSDPLIEKSSRSRRPKKARLIDENRDNENEEQDEPDAPDYNSDDDLAATALNDSCFETGQILKVFMQDFMCHRKFTVDFGRNVNFITGQNGSGKSAIVAALQLCLGATARSTGRGANMAALIREGSDGPAILQVTLLNQGSDSHNPQLYGDRIIIERKIPKTGSSTYRLLNKNGQLVSNKKEDLEKILQVFNIFADNPCCILTQEESKKFIQGHEKEKYEFFLKASGLDVTQEEIARVKTQIDSAKESLTQHDEKLALKKEVLNKLKADYRRLVALDDYETDIQDCLAKIYWREAADASDALTEVNEAFADAQKKLVDAKAAAAEAERELNEGVDFSVVTEQIESFQRTLDELGRDVEKKAGAVNTIKKKLNQMETARQAAIKARGEEIKSSDDVSKRIHEYTEKAKADADGDERVILENLDKCDKAADSLKARDLELRHEKNAVSAGVDRIETKERDMNNVFRSEGKNLDKLKADRASLQSSGGKLGMYGGRMDEVLKAIQSDKSFKERVYGPLGMHITIGSEFKRFGYAIESAISKRILSAFLVTNDSDRSALTRILARFGSDGHAIIMQTKHARYPVHDIPDVNTVARALNIVDDIVFNAVVDATGIDLIALVESVADVDRFVVVENGHKSLRKPLNKAMDVHATSVFYRSGSKANIPVKDKYNQFLCEDMAEMVRTYDEQIRGMEEQMHVYTVELKEVRAEKDVLSKRLHAIETELRSVSDKQRMQHKRKLELENQREECLSSAQIDISPLIAERDERAEAIRSLNDEITRLTAEADGVKADLKVAEADKKNYDKQKESLNTELKEAEGKLHDQMGVKDKASKALEVCNRTLQKVERQVEAAERDVTAKIKVSDDRIEEANEQTLKLLGPRWDGMPLNLTNKETKEKLRGTIASKQALLEKGKKDAGLQGQSKSVMEKKLFALLEAYNSDVAYSESLNSTLQNLEEDYKTRAVKWSKMLNNNSQTVKRCFDKYLQKKGFAGDLTIDHETKKLHINCQTDNRDEKTQCNDVRQLSGGERSFTTLSLLMALGHVMEAPFRLMDEYDVFLDEMTRKVTLINLQKYALDAEQRNRQFIIITPQNLSDVRTSNEVRIRSLGAPVRTSAHGMQQQVLNFAAAEAS